MSQFATDAGPLIPLAKPLNWRKPTDHPQDRENAMLVAPGLGGQYTIEKYFSTLYNKDRFTLWMAHDEFIHHDFETLERAKECAERDWQHRFRRKTK